MRVLTVTLLAVGLLGAGCGARAVTPEPFGEFSVSRSGGVAGVRDVLRVAPSGVAVVTSPTPRAGRLSADRVAHARRLLESGELAREARAVRGDTDDRCVDTFVSTVRMGSWSMAVAGTCRASGRQATPAFDELMEVVGDARRGVFDEPLAPGDVPAVEVRVEQPATTTTTASTVTLDADGHATRRLVGGATEHVDLPRDQQDAAALVGAGLLGTTPGGCTSPGSPTVEVVASDGGRVRGSACGFGPRALDALALAVALGRAFDR